MFDELIKEWQELKQELEDYKQKYEKSEQDKQRLSDRLFEYMIAEYKNMSYDDRCRKFYDNRCSICDNLNGCEQKDHLPENVFMPIKIKTNIGWIIKRVGCDDFIHQCML